MSVIKWVLTLIVLFVMVVFGVKNMDPVTVTYYFNKTVTMPKFLLMAILVFAGAFLAAFVGLLEQLKLRSRIRGQARIIKKLEKELSSLRPASTVQPADNEDDQIGFDR